MAVRYCILLKIRPNLMLFGEYRFTHVPVSVDDLRGADTREARLKTNLDSHSALLGLSARW